MTLTPPALPETFYWKIDDDRSVSAVGKLPDKRLLQVSAAGHRDAQHGNLGVEALHARCEVVADLVAKCLAAAPVHTVTLPDGWKGETYRLLTAVSSTDYADLSPLRPQTPEARAAYKDALTARKATILSMDPVSEQYQRMAHSN